MYFICGKPESEVILINGYNERLGDKHPCQPGMSQDKNQRKNVTF